jgi:hypothetical protein
MLIWFTDERREVGQNASLWREEHPFIALYNPRTLLLLLDP